MQLGYRLTKAKIGNIIFIMMIAVFWFVPTAKALVLTGLMKAGLFSPAMASNENITAKIRMADLSGITFKDGSGKIIDLGDLKGKVIFLNFWATWCPPCQAEMPAINKLYKQFKADGDIVFIMADADSDYAKAKKYMGRKKFELPVHTVTSSIPDQLFNGALPTTVVFDKRGRISFKEEGAVNYADAKFVAFIKALKEQP